MLALFRPAIVVFLALTLITGVLYPALVTLVSAGVFPKQAGGSLVVKDGKSLGSELISQGFSDPRYFWPRPSAAGYSGAGGSGSNMGPTHPNLRKTVENRVSALCAVDPGNKTPIPVELVTASGSGLDPHLSPAAARYQVARVARVRGRSPDEVGRLVELSIEPRTLGALGEPRVNVLMLNLALDELVKPATAPSAGGTIRLDRQRAFMPD